MRRAFGPIADDRDIPAGVFYSGESHLESPAIPMILCTTFHEWNPNRVDAALEKITQDGVIEKLRSQYGDKAGSIVKTFAKNFPDKTPMELWAMILSSRQRVVEAANAKLKQGQPVCVAWFGWCPPLFDNRIRALHCSDICFWFKNTDRTFTHTNGGKVPHTLSDKMSGALLDFIRTGDPNGGKLPVWPKYTEENGKMMILNNTCEAWNDPDREARKSSEV